MTPEILIVGGGFAGFWAALAAKRIAGERASVTLVSSTNLLEVRPRLYEANPETLGVQISLLLQAAGVSFVGGEASRLDPAARFVGLANGERIHYHRLVVATGSRMRRPTVPGADEPYSIDTQKEAIAFDHRLREIAQRVARPTVAIVGAGFTGIELALEMRERIAAHGGAGVGKRSRIMLIDRADVVGAPLGAGPRSAIETALAAARIELRLRATITELSRERVTLAGGATIDASVVVLTTGLAAAPFAGLVPGARDHLGRVVVDRTLRAPAAPEIFVTGDAAAADTGDGHLTLQSCQHALQLGRFAGENAARDLLGMPTRQYAQRRYVTCLDLGASGAVLSEGWERNVVRTGPKAKLLKQYINRVLIYPPAGATGELLLALSTADPMRQRLLAAVGTVRLFRKKALFGKRPVRIALQLLAVGLLLWSRPTFGLGRLRYRASPRVRGLEACRTPREGS